MITQRNIVIGVFINDFRHAALGQNIDSARLVLRLRSGERIAITWAQRAYSSPKTLGVIHINVVSY